MASVSPTDGGYQYYQRTIDDLENDLREEAEKTRRNYETSLAETEADHIAELRKKDEETAETVKNIKENLEETLQSEKEINKEEIKRIKNETYDKFGRYQGNEADVLKTQLTKSKEAWDERHKADQKMLQDAEDIYQRNLQKKSDEHATQLEKVVAQSRDSANEAFHNQSLYGRTAYDEYINDLKNQYSQLINRKMEESNLERREFENSFSNMKLDLDRQLQRLTDNNTADSKEREAYHSNAIEEAVRKTSDTGEATNKELRTQIRNLLSNDERYQKEKAKGSSDAIREYERDWYKREKMIQNTYENMLANERRQGKRAEEHAGTILSEAIRERNLKSANAINTLMAEAQANQKEFLDIFQKDREQTDLRLQKEKEMASSRNESLARELNERSAKALEEQAKAFNNTIKDIRNSDESKVKALENQLKSMNSSDNPGAVSPAAEAHLRNSLIKEYEKTFSAWHNANEEKVDELQKNFSNKLHDTLFNAEAELTRTQRQNAAQSHAERTNLMQHIEGTEFSKHATLRHQEGDHRRELENLNREFAIFMERQKRQSDEVLENTKNDLYTKMQNARQEAEFKERLQQREFALKLNEQAREDEKKIMDQKADFDLSLHEAKAEADRSLRDKDRQHKLELDELNRSFEQRVIQQELQHKERERAAQENFENEIDKIRRTNNAILQRRA